jgi:hypothetical protein
LTLKKEEACCSYIVIDFQSTTWHYIYNRTSYFAYVAAVGWRIRFQFVTFWLTADSIYYDSHFTTLLHLDKIIHFTF